VTLRSTNWHTEQEAAMRWSPEGANLLKVGAELLNGTLLDGLPNRESPIPRTVGVRLPRRLTFWRPRMRSTLSFKENPQRLRVSESKVYTIVAISLGCLTRSQSANI